MPLREFLDTEAAGGLALLAATAVALGWANSPWSRAYEALWGTELAAAIGAVLLHRSLPPAPSGVLGRGEGR
jgi:Na+/H+ antiporter NhaA